MLKTAIFPVAGFGTRLLPATKAVPKELLPVLRKPVLQYAIDEAKAAGVERFIFVHSRGKEILENHIDSYPALERRVLDDGKTALAQTLRDSSIPVGQAIFVRQPEPLGLGHAILCARAFAGDDPFAVLLPDDIIVGGEAPCLAEMAAAYRPELGSMIASQTVPLSETGRYGILEPVATTGRLVSARTVVEKPKPEFAPSRHAVVGRYILPPQIMAALAETKPGAGGEIQLTDAIAAITPSAGLHGFGFSGTRFDCGTIEGYLQANVTLAMADPALRRCVEAAVDAARHTDRPLVCAGEAA